MLQWLSGDGQSALVVKVEGSPSRYLLLIGSHLLSSGDSTTGPRPQCWDGSLNPSQLTIYNLQSTRWASRAGLDTQARGQILCLCRRSNLDRPVVQSVARHYTDWATWLLFVNHCSQGLCVSACLLLTCRDCFSRFDLVDIVYNRILLCIIF
jgi:hypothetical protein